eukprot:1542139-Amphidinium_carterae.1
MGMEAASCSTWFTASWNFSSSMHSIGSTCKSGIRLKSEVERELLGIQASAGVVPLGETFFNQSSQRHNMSQ